LPCDAFGCRTGYVFGAAHAGTRPLDRHMTTPHIKNLIPKMGKVLAEPFTQTRLSAMVI
jgi:hypothetical protein